MFLCVYISLLTSCLCAASCVINDDDDDRTDRQRDRQLTIAIPRFALPAWAVKNEQKK